MQITSVHYQKLVNTGNYENERVGAWSNVAEGQDPAEVLAELKLWVNQQLGEDQESREVKSEIARLWNRRDLLRYDLDQLESNLRRARDVWQVASDFLRKHGVGDLAALADLPDLEPERPTGLSDDLELMPEDDEDER